MDVGEDPRGDRLTPGPTCASASGSSRATAAKKTSPPNVAMAAVARSGTSQTPQLGPVGEIAAPAAAPGEVGEVVRRVEAPRPAAVRADERVGDRDTGPVEVAVVPKPAAGGTQLLQQEKSSTTVATAGARSIRAPEAVVHGW